MPQRTTLAMGGAPQAAATPQRAALLSKDQAQPPKAQPDEQWLDEPLLTSTKTARRLLDIGNTKFWDLVKSGQIQMVEVGGRRMVLYASLRALASFPAV